MIAMARKKIDLTKLQNERGIRCPNCHCTALEVKWTEPIGTRIKRHRFCLYCKYGPIVTWEELAEPLPPLSDKP